MSDPGAPRPRGRHASPDADTGGVPAPWTTPAPPSHGAHSGAGRRSSDPLDAGAAAQPGGDDDTAAWAPVRPRRRADVLAGAPTAGMRRVPGDPHDLPGLQWRPRGAGPENDGPRPPADEVAASWGGARGGDGDDRPLHPSAPLPPRPPGT